MSHNFFNLSKRKKRNILSELLAGQSTEGIISKKELNALNKLIAGQPLRNTPVKKINQPTKTKSTATIKKSKSARRKRTHYVSQEISESINRAQKVIPSHVPEEFRTKISKSQIVEEALAIILQDFESKGKKSRLMLSILQKITARNLKNAAL